MIQTMYDRQNGDLFWKKKNLLDQSEMLKESFSAASVKRSERGSGSVKGEGAGVGKKHSRGTDRVSAERIGAQLFRILEKETGPIDSDMTMGELPGFKRPERFIPGDEDKQLFGLFGCRACAAWLSDFISSHGSFFNDQMLPDLFFNNEGLSECHARAKALRDSVDALTSSDFLLYLNKEETNELLNIWVESEVAARVSGNALEFILWAGSRTRNEIEGVIAEELAEMNSILIRKEAIACLSKILKDRSDRITAEE